MGNKISSCLKKKHKQYQKNLVGKSKSVVNVIVEDVNDNAPIFDLPTYNLTLFGDVSNGAHVLTAHAEDMDSGSYGRVNRFFQKTNFYTNIYRFNTQLKTTMKSYFESILRQGICL